MAAACCCGCIGKTTITAAVFTSRWTTPRGSSDEKPGQLRWAWVRIALRENAVIVRLWPLYGSHWPISKRRRSLSRQGHRRRTISAARRCFWFALVRPQTHSPAWSAYFDTRCSLKNHCHRAELRRPRAGAEQAIAQGAVILDQGDDVVDSRRRQD